jgi:hypothetical protein
MAQQHVPIVPRVHHNHSQVKPIVIYVRLVPPQVWVVKRHVRHASLVHSVTLQVYKDVSIVKLVPRNHYQVNHHVHHVHQVNITLSQHNPSVVHVPQVHHRMPQVH